MTAVPPLLLLAAGGKPRLHRARVPVQKELSLHKDVAKLLRDHCLPDWKYFHPANGEKRDIRTAARLKSLGVIKGIPDLVLISPHGSAHFLEFKRPGGELSEEQAEFRLWCVKHNVPYVVAWRMDQVLEELDLWGCLRIVLPARKGEANV